MDLRTVQAELKAYGLYKGDVDGDYGPKTSDAIDALAATQSMPLSEGWSDNRRLVAAYQLLARSRGIDPGTIDGLMGPSTRHAMEVYDARRKNDWKPVAEVEKWRDELEHKIITGQEKPPTPSHDLPAPVGHNKPPVWPRQSQVGSYFGGVGTRQTELILPYPMLLAWDTGKKVREIQCHEKVRENMERIFKRTLDHYGLAEIHRLRLDLWGGTLNVRKMRGGDNWSMHSWGIATDIDPEHNQLKWKRAQATLDNKEYDPFWRFVYDEGAISLGRERDYDWMHFQFALL